MPVRTRRFIASSSPAVAGRLTRAITASRTDPWPMNIPKFTEVRSASIRARYGPMGTGEPPSGPSKIVVTPCRT